jgi:hypothetical protein
MKLFLPLFIAFACVVVAFAGDAQTFQLRFSNDYAKAVEFYIDEKFGCGVPANPEGNNAYCDAKTSPGEHTVTVKGEGLSSRPCKFYIVRPEGAYVNLTKAGHLGCMNLLSAD